MSLYIILKAESIKNILLEDNLYIPESIKSLFSWSKLNALYQYYQKDYGNIIIYKIVNKKEILWVKEYLHTNLFNIPT
jgi:hypothetical protein